MHEMKLFNDPFERIKNGSKKIEIRLNDEKRRLVNIGDIIQFKNIDSNELISVRVINLYKFDNFKELFSSFDKSVFGYKDNEEFNYSDMYKYYTKEEEKKYGVLGIELELLGGKHE